MARKISGKTPKAYFRSGIPVPERPWYALTESQKELRLDTVAWHEGHDIFLHELLEHPVKRVRSCASSTNQETMKLMIRAYKQGVDLAQVPLGTLIGTPLEDWASLPRAPLSLHAGAENEGRVAGRGARGGEKRPAPRPRPRKSRSQGRFPRRRWAGHFRISTSCSTRSSKRRSSQAAGNSRSESRRPGRRRRSRCRGRTKRPASRRARGARQPATSLVGHRAQRPLRPEIRREAAGERRCRERPRKFNWGNSPVEQRRRN